MVAPEVPSLMVTDCAGPYAPAAGLNVGVAAGPLMTYAAEPTALCE